MNKEIVCADWVGQTIDGRFPLTQWLGGVEGSGVFLTELPEDRSHQAAIKLIPANGRDVEALITEWTAKMQLSHPRLTRLFYSGQCDLNGVHLLYAVTEYAEENLAEVLPVRPLTPAETREMLSPLLDVLTFLHARGFAHGSIKPSNLLVVNDQLKLSWDNLHVAGNQGDDLPAPETQTAPATPASDLWSLGVLLVQALTQHLPLWERSTQKDPVVPESMPQPFAGIARECLRPDPAIRCTLSGVKARLETPRPLPIATSKTGVASVNPLVKVGVAAVVVLVAVAAILLTRSHQTQPSQPAPDLQSATTTTQPTQVPVAQAPVTEAPPPSPATESTAPEDQSAPPETQAPPPAVQIAKPSAGKNELVAKPAAVKNELPTRGDVVEQIMPDVSRQAMATIHGTVKVSIRLSVDASGNVSNATIDSQTSQYFATRAQQAAEQWKFKPAQINGQPASSQWLLRFEFTTANAKVTPIRVSP
jgi:serine/threonine-protein kinase